MSWTEILVLIPPTNLALLVVIIWLFRCLERKDKMVQELGSLISANSEATCKLSTLVSILVNGRRV
jgi:hypothetical protein